MDYVVNSVMKVWEKREEIKGFDLTYEPPVLRHFTAKFKWTD
jgi:tryptophanase